MYLHSEKYPDFEVIARRVFGRSSLLLGDIFGIWISDFRVLDFEEGGAAELGGGAGIHGLEPLGKWLQGFSVGQTTSAMQADDSVD